MLLKKRRPTRNNGVAHRPIFLICCAIANLQDTQPKTSIESISIGEGWQAFVQAQVLEPKRRFIKGITAIVSYCKFVPFAFLSMAEDCHAQENDGDDFFHSC
jgi:hypothetical protein